MKKQYESPLYETVTFEKWDILTLSIGGGYGKNDDPSLGKGNNGTPDKVGFEDLGF